MFGAPALVRYLRSRNLDLWYPLVNAKLWGGESQFFAAGRAKGRAALRACPD